MKIAKQSLVIPDPIGNPSGYIKGIILLVLTFGAFLYFFGISRKPLSVSPTFSTDFAYDNRTFFPAISQYPHLPKGSSPSVLVIPHHLTASNVIARGISLLTADPPRTIILLSPNHANIGQCDIVSSSNGWDTPFGQILVDQDLQSSFIKYETACLDDSALIPEHGLAGLMPFLAYYLPNTKVIPFALKKNIDPILLERFSQQLISASPHVVVIASIDFSHGLNHDQAVERDTRTESLIRDHNYSVIEKLSSEYLDSPASLISTLKIIQTKSLSSEILVHTDSFSFNNIPESVTSYYLLIGKKIANPNTSPSPADIRDLKSKINTTTLVFGGDVMLGRSVNTRMIKYRDFSWPFRKIANLLSTADLTIVNLESPFNSDCQPTDTGMFFCADPRSVDGLILAGIDIVNLANNHISNQGKEGFDFTLSLLNQNKITPIGLGKLVIKDVRKTKVAFLGFNDTPPYFTEVAMSWPINISGQIAYAKSQANIVVASFHWGNEYRQRTSHQVELARLAIDSGADVVIGHHPHWVQEVEIYKEKPIYYSLGNLVFDQMWSEETRKGLLVKLVFSGNTLVNQEQTPIKIFDYGQPAPL